MLGMEWKFQSVYIIKRLDSKEMDERIILWSILFAAYLKMIQYKTQSKHILRVYTIRSAPAYRQVGTENTKREIRKYFAKFFFVDAKDVVH